MKAKRAADELIEQSERLLRQAKDVQKDAESLPEGDDKRKRLEELAGDLVSQSESLMATARSMLK